METKSRQYIAIDLKSFYASVECVERGLPPLTTNLLVADNERTDKTICLAVSPSLKACGIPGRPRLFEAKQRVREANIRRAAALGRRLQGESNDSLALEADPRLAIGFITAPPRMALYIDYSSRIYAVYLRHIAPEDIHVYSIDEVFIDATNYLATYRLTAEGLARRILADVLRETGITATAGIGTNLYLAKVAMDIVAKRTAPDRDGARLATLDEQSYRRLMWEHQPITDFWRVGRGYAAKLAADGMRTMGDVARCSLGAPGQPWSQALLYRLFGVNAELLIDHAWGVEPCTIADIKRYRPTSSSLSSGQVLHSPYPFAQARVVAREMADNMALDLVERRLTTRQITLTVGYDTENLTRPEGDTYRGPVVVDPYGRPMPRHAHATANLPRTSSANKIMEAVTAMFDQIVDKTLTIRRITISVCLLESEQANYRPKYRQLDLFADNDALRQREKQERTERERERRIQQTVIELKNKYGKNAVLRGLNFEEGATAKDRNRQIGGHKA